MSCTDVKFRMMRDTSGVERLQEVSVQPRRVLGWACYQSMKQIACGHTGIENGCQSSGHTSQKC